MNMSDLSRKNKNNFFQVVRAICICAVILIHLKAGSDASNSYDYWIVFRRIVNFAVPIFFFMSGYFVNIESVKENPFAFVRKRCTRLIIPLFIWGVLYGLISKDVSIKMPLKAILGLTAAHLYYIVVLVQLILLTPILLKLLENKRKYINALSLLISPLYLCVLYISNIVFDFNMPYYYNYGFWAWIIFYHLGIMLKKEQCFIDKISLSKLCLFSILTLFISIVEGLTLSDFFISKGHAPFLSYTQLSFGSFLYSISLIMIIVKIHKKVTVGTNNFLVSIGNYSFGIYFVHMAFVILLGKFIFDPTNLFEYICYQLVSFTFIISLSYLFIRLGCRIFGERISRHLGFV